MIPVKNSDKDSYRGERELNPFRQILTQCDGRQIDMVVSGTNGLRKLLGVTARRRVVDHHAAYLAGVSRSAAAGFEALSISSAICSCRAISDPRCSFSQGVVASVRSLRPRAAAAR